MAEEKEDMKKRKSKKNASKYNYTFGDDYPGVKFGHKTCDRFLMRGYNVPARMGWLWTAHDPSGMKPRKGWAPGGIAKSVLKVMTLKCPRNVGKDKDKKKKKKRKPGEQAAEADSEQDEPLEPKPALMVQRKGDEFTIKVNPLKDLNQLGNNEDPYEDCEPLVFKIYKKRSPEEKAKAEARKMVKLKKQRDAEIRKALSEAVEDICKCAYMDIYCNDFSAIDRVIETCPTFKEPECVCKKESLSSLSSNATWDIEYTPPFGCFDLAPKEKVTYVHVDTQFCRADAGIKEPELKKTVQNGGRKIRQVCRKPSQTSKFKSSRKNCSCR